MNKKPSKRIKVRQVTEVTGLRKVVMAFVEEASKRQTKGKGWQARIVSRTIKDMED